MTATTGGDQMQLQSRFHRFYQQLAPSLKKPKTQASTTTIFSFLAVSLFAWYAVRPTAQTIIYLRKEIADKIVLNKQMEDKITALIEAQSTFESIQSQLPLLEQAMPKNPDAVILARQLYRIASASQVTIAAILVPSLPLVSSEASAGAKLSVSKPLVGEFPVSIVLSGDYPAVKSFLEGLLMLRRIATIDTISIKQSVNQETQGTGLQLSIRFKSYYSTQ